MNNKAQEFDISLSDMLSKLIQDDSYSVSNKEVEELDNNQMPNSFEIEYQNLTRAKTLEHANKPSLSGMKPEIKHNFTSQKTMMNTNNRVPSNYHKEPALSNLSLNKKDSYHKLDTNNIIKNNEIRNMPQYNPPLFNSFNLRAYSDGHVMNNQPYMNLQYNPYLSIPQMNINPQYFYFNQRPQLVPNYPNYYIGPYINGPQLSNISKPIKNTVKNEESSSDESSTSHLENTKRDLKVTELLNSQAPASIILKMKSIKQIKPILDQFEPNEILLLFNRLLPDFKKIMTDYFGNYFCQEYFNYLGKKERLKLWKLLDKSEIFYYSTNDYSNHCLQKLVSIASSSDDKEQKKICDLYYIHFKNLIYDSKGTHILQKIILNFKFHNKLSLINLLNDNIEDLACDSKGVCLIKQHMASLTNEKSCLRINFVNLISNCLIKYMTDKYGHYLILYMIEKWSEKDMEQIILFIKKNLPELSRNIYSSRIIDKCLLTYKEVSITLIILFQLV